MRSSLVVVLAVLAAACKQPEAPGARAAAPTAAPPAAPAAAPIKGKVLERTDTDIYSYLRLSTANGEVWAAVPRTDAAVGTEVSVVNWADVPGFEGKAVKKKFDHIYFGVLAGQAGATGAPSPGGSPHVTPPPGEPSVSEMAARHAAAAAGPADAASVKVEKAKGADARTVAEVYGQKATLKGKTVVVRAKVVKFMPGIMGRNWVHLRDGTGGQGSNDLTITTGDKVDVGDVVVAKGTVATDRDFGAGYAYPVMLEGAKVAK